MKVVNEKPKCVIVSSSELEDSLLAEDYMGNGEENEKDKTVCRGETKEEEN